jgi:glucosamine--fructose-6-phosphate aminotransferase (isomerizing)
MPRDGAAIVISQSGETADTLAALRYCRAAGQKIIAIVNQPESTIAREADVVLPTLAGPEIGVASTKAFTTQLAVLAAFTIAMARARGTIDAAEEARLAGQLAEVSSRASEVLHHDREPSRRSRPLSRWPATSSISAAAPPIRWRSKAR